MVEILQLWIFLQIFIRSTVWIVDRQAFITSLFFLSLSLSLWFSLRIWGFFGLM